MAVDLLVTLRRYKPTTIPPVKRRNIAPVYLNSFVQTSENFPKLEKITLATAKKMYGVGLKPRTGGVGENIYPTYVLDKNDKPVEVFVKIESIKGDREDYCIYDKTLQNVLATRTFRINSAANELDSGYMKTSAKEFKGLGLRGHQMAVERMLMRKFNNMEIVCVPQAYKFHKGAGFDSVKQILILDKDYYEKLLQGYSKSCELDINKIKELAVICPNAEPGKVNMDKFATYENILKYLYEINDDYIIGTCHMSLHMKLSPEAIKEWQQLIRLSPIFMGKKFPTGTV